jgi:hypothetical protein
MRTAFTSCNVSMCDSGTLINQNQRETMQKWRISVDGSLPGK